MNFETGVTMVALVIGAFAIGIVVGRWPSWTRQRRVRTSAACVVTLAVVGLAWAFLVSIVIPSSGYTHLILFAGSGLYLKDHENPERYQSRSKDGWNRPFVQRLSIEQEPIASGGAEAAREYLAFEVRSLGPNGVVDDDDMWVLFEVMTANGNLQLVGRQWGGIDDDRPEAWTFPREDQNPPPRTAPLPPTTNDGTMNP